MGISNTPMLEEVSANLVEAGVSEEERTNFSGKLFFNISICSTFM